MVRNLNMVLATNGPIKTIQSNPPHAKRGNAIIQHIDDFHTPHFYLVDAP